MVNVLNVNEIAADSKGKVLRNTWEILSFEMIVFNFVRFFVVIDGISPNDLFQASVFPKDYSRKCAKRLSSTLICLQYEPVFP